jgi:hypothetical protein
MDFGGNDAGPPPERVIPSVTKLAVRGFGGAVNGGTAAEVVRSPISGGLFTAGPVPQTAVNWMNDVLFEMLVERGTYEYISPAQTRGVYVDLMASDENLSLSPRQALRTVGAALEADAVLAGHIYRWQEREGSDYGVTRPASVAFDLHMIRPATGEVIWSAKFDKTQRSLTEDLFDYATFVKSGGKWLTAEKLARIGLSKMISGMPKGAARGGSS